MRVKAWDSDAAAMRAWDGLTAFGAAPWLLIGSWTGSQSWQLTGSAAGPGQAGNAPGPAGAARPGAACATGGGAA